MNQALNKLGEPEEYLATVVSDWWLHNAAANRNPGNVLKAVFYSFVGGFRRALRALSVAIGLIVSLSLALVGLLKFFLVSLVLGVDPLLANAPTDERGVDTLAVQLDRSGCFSRLRDQVLVSAGSMWNTLSLDRLLFGQLLVYPLNGVDVYQAKEV